MKKRTPSHPARPTTAQPAPNRLTWADADATTTLSYSLVTNPSPLTVSSSSSQPTLATLQIVVANSMGDDVDVASIDFAFSVGSGSSITPTTAGIITTLYDSTAGNSANWTITDPGVINQGTADYTLEPASDANAYNVLEDGESVVVGLSGIQLATSPQSSTSASPKPSATARSGRMPCRSPCSRPGCSLRTSRRTSTRAARSFRSRRSRTAARWC